MWVPCPCPEPSKTHPKPWCAMPLLTNSTSLNLAEPSARDAAARAADELFDWRQWTRGPVHGIAHFPGYAPHSKFQQTEKTLHSKQSPGKLAISVTTLINCHPIYYKSDQTLWDTLWQFMKFCSCSSYFHSLQPPPPLIPSQVLHYQHCTVRGGGRRVCVLGGGGGGA